MEIALITLSVLSFIAALASITTLLIFYFIMPQKFTNQAKGYMMTGKREEKRLWNIVQEEATALIINENPEMLKAFPQSTDFAIQKDLVPQFAGQLTGMFAPILGNILNSQIENPMLQGLVSTAVGNEKIIEAIDKVFDRLFGSRRKKRQESKPKEEPKKGSDQAAFPAFT